MNTYRVSLGKFLLSFVHLLCGLKRALCWIFLGRGVGVKSKLVAL